MTEEERKFYALLEDPESGLSKKIHFLFYSLEDSFPNSVAFLSFLVDNTVRQYEKVDHNFNKDDFLKIMSEIYSYHLQKKV